MTKVYVHVHRADRPGRCYWAALVENRNRVFGLHPDFGHAEPVAERDVIDVANGLSAQFDTCLELLLIPACQPEAVPKPLRERLRLG